MSLEDAEGQLATAQHVHFGFVQHDHRAGVRKVPLGWQPGQIESFPVQLFRPAALVGT